MDLTKPALSKKAFFKSSNLKDEYGRGMCTLNFPAKQNNTFKNEKYQ